MPERRATVVVAALAVALAKCALPGMVSSRRADGVPTRRRVVQGALAALVVPLTGVFGSQPARAESARVRAEAPKAFNVMDFGAIGNGSTNDSAAVVVAINAAAGAPVLFPSGRVFVLDNVLVKATADLLVESGAVLLARPNMGNNAMFNFSGTNLSLRGGGTIDGNKSNQPGRPFVVVAAIPAGVVVKLDGLVFRNTVASVVRGSLFGGLVSITNCSFTGQAEHDGVSGHSTTIMTIIAGQKNSDGVIRFNHNTCTGTTAPALPGGGPGGIFVATNGYEAGPPGSDGFSDGNLSTLEAIGNYFYGYGQNCGGNDISPIHTYPAIGGARVIGNYFEKCGFCAISGKSAQNFVCTGNVIVNGQTSSQNPYSEGAISYMPGYNAGSTSRPRAVISGNIIDSPGGQSLQFKQHGIAVHGISTSFAEDVLISDNVISGCGAGIQLAYVTNATIRGNIIQGSVGGAVGVEHGVRVDQIYGSIVISGNQIRTRNGYGIFAAQVGTLVNARIFVLDNVLEHSSPHIGCIIRGVALAKFSGNTISATSGTAVSVGGDGTNPTRILVWDATNTVLAGSIVLDFAWIEVDARPCSLSEIAGGSGGSTARLSLYTIRCAWGGPSLG